VSDVKISYDQENGALLQSFLNCTLKEIMAVIHAECGSLFLFDSEHEELVLSSFYNAQKLSIRGMKKRIGEGVSGKVIDIKAPVLVKDINSDSRFKRNGFGHYRTNSFISIPIFSADRLLGLINLTDKSTGEPLSDNDLKIAVTISRYACLAFDSVHSYTLLRQEKENLDKQKALIEKYASVGKLATGVVHEVNNPLDGIMRYTHMLLDHAPEKSVEKEYLLEIQKGLQRIAHTTNSLLEFSRQVNSGSVVHSKKIVKISEALDDALDCFSEHLGGIHVVKKLGHPRDHIIDLGLHHVFLNIIKNAIEAMSGTGELLIETQETAGMFSISFQDSGVGIPDDIAGKIFDAFFTTKIVNKGTGLGLAICKEMVGRYGGKIEATSCAQSGARFTVLIPAKFLEYANSQVTV